MSEQSQNGATVEVQDSKRGKDKVYMKGRRRCVKRRMRCSGAGEDALRDICRCKTPRALIFFRWRRGPTAAMREVRARRWGYLTVLLTSSHDDSLAVVVRMGNDDVLDEKW